MLQVCKKFNEFFQIMADCTNDQDCPCTNVVIMQLFHELKQKFPYVPDRVVNECIQKNGHDKDACEYALEKENRVYLLHSYPLGLTARMASEDHLNRFDENVNNEICDEFSFDRRLLGRQSLDSLYRKNCRRKTVTFKHHSDETLNESSSNCSGDFQNLFVSDNSNINKKDLPNVSSSVLECNCKYRGCGSASTSLHCQAQNKNRPQSLMNETGNIDCSGNLSFYIDSDIKSCCCDRTSFSVVSSCKVERGPTNSHPHSAPVTPSTNIVNVFPPLSLDVTTRKTNLNMEPSPPYSAELDSPSQRSFTSVNFTLRPPSSDPQVPIDISSSARGMITYSTYDPRQGFQSKLKISIGSNGQGTVSATRTKATPIHNKPALPLPVPTPSTSHRPAPPPPPPPIFTDGISESVSKLELIEQLDDTTKAIVTEQLNRKNLLQKEYEKEKQRLIAMEKQVADMEKKLEIKQTNRVEKRKKIEKLKEDIIRLCAECKYLTAEADISLGPGVNNPSISAAGTSEPSVTNVGPAAEIDSGHLSSAASGGSDGPNWICNMCTFRNHPLLLICEQCDGPRDIFGTNISSCYSLHSASDSDRFSMTNTNNSPPSKLANANPNKAPNIVH